MEKTSSHKNMLCFLKRNRLFPDGMKEHVLEHWKRGGSGPTLPCRACSPANTMSNETSSKNAEGGKARTEHTLFHPFKKTASRKHVPLLFEKYLARTIPPFTSKWPHYERYVAQVFMFAQKSESKSERHVNLQFHRKEYKRVELSPSFVPFFSFGQFLTTK